LDAGGVLFRLNRCIVWERHACTKYVAPITAPGILPLYPVRIGLAAIRKGAFTMSKGMDSKKQSKKEPAKTMKEKRAAKKAKKESKGGMR
jgi:hypothetical protein